MKYKTYLSEQNYLNLSILHQLLQVYFSIAAIGCFRNLRLGVEPDDYIIELLYDFCRSFRG